MVCGLDYVGMPLLKYWDSANEMCTFAVEAGVQGRDAATQCPPTIKPIIVTTPFHHT